MAPPKSANNAPLFEPTKLGDLNLGNRIIMPALTRCRCGPDRSITQDQVEYYKARASAGLIVTEPSAVSASAHGYGKAPGLYEPAQAAGWKKVTDAVHSQNGAIVCQLWHTGRMSHSSFLPSGQNIVAPSAVRVGEEAGKAEGGVKTCGVQAADGTWQSHEVPRELLVPEIEAIVEDFGKSAALAVSAGFDGIEIHAGGGYLIDTFLQSSTNLRQDKYGGNATGRATLLMEIVQRISAELPLSRVGVRLTPNSGFNGMGADDNAETFATVVRLLDQARGADGSSLAYLHVQDGIGAPGSMPSFYGRISSDGFHKRGAYVSLKDLRPLFAGGLISNGTHSAESAAEAVASGVASAVSFGRFFLGNADLVAKFRAGQPLDPPPPEETWFGASTQPGVAPSWGYTEMAPLKPRTRVLHLLGSPASDYYEQLSTMYARGCVASCGPPCAADFEFVYAVVHAEGPSWSFPKSLEPSAIASAPRVPIADGLSKLAALNADVAQSHMFCVQGVSTYRAILDLLGVPFVGGSVDAMTLTTHKGRSKAVAAAAGVPCAPSEVLRAGDRPSLPFPFIVKPCSEDNSMGVSVVRSASELDAALDSAFEFDDEVLCEAFVPPGREIRFAVLESGECDEHGTPKLIALPGVEYFMTKEKPIRTSNDKLTSDSSGKLSFAKPSRACPAEIDDTLLAKLTDAATKAHFALGCRDYSLYDFRIDPEGNIFFLEASLFCCFAPNSVISMMADATGEPNLAHQTLFKALLRRALARKPEQREAGAVQALGSMQKKQKVGTVVTVA